MGALGVRKAVDRSRLSPLSHSGKMLHPNVCTLRCRRRLLLDIGAQSTIAFAVASPCSAIRLSYVPYGPPGGKTNHLTVVVNGAKRRSVMTGQHTCRVDLHDNPLQPGKPVLIEFLVSRPLRPDIDGGDDKRPLGFALFKLELIGVRSI